MVPTQGGYKISYGWRRDKGLVREENQDQIVSFESSTFGIVFLLADGMGGHENGAVAANMAITGFKQHFQSLSQQLPLRECIEEAARLTNLDIFDASKGNGDTPGTLRMGSTLVVCVLSGSHYVIAHAGDSRVYSLRNGILTRLTKDHSAVQKLVDGGIISPEEARNHPDASVLTRALGQRASIEVDISETTALDPDETLLICSDGLHGYVSDETIVRELLQHQDPQAGADALLRAALDTGGHDNISIFVVRAAPSSSAAVPPPEMAAAHPVPPAALKKPGKSLSGEKKKSRPALALWLILAGLVIATAPLLLFFRPDLVPESVRTQLAAWKIPLPGTATSSSDDTSTAPTQNTQAPKASSSRALPANKAAANKAAANKAATNNPAANNPAAPGASGSSKPSSASAPETASLAPTPTGTSNQPPFSVIVAYPEDSGAEAMSLVERYKAQLRDAGYNVVGESKPDSVWRTMVKSPAVPAPGRQLISAVFLPGYDKAAAKICQAISCTDHTAHAVTKDDLPTFRDNFGDGRVVVFLHPGKRASVALKKSTGKKE
jgi:serine/threonine protein phosphatase PrpC